MRLNCISEAMTKLMLGITFTVMGLGAVAIGLTVLPIIGILMSVPLFGLAFYFYHAHLNRECRIPER